MAQLSGGSDQSVKTGSRLRRAQGRTRRLEASADATCQQLGLSKTKAGQNLLRCCQLSCMNSKALFSLTGETGNGTWVSHVRQEASLRANPSCRARAVRGLSSNKGESYGVTLRSRGPPPEPPDPRRPVSRFLACERRGRSALAAGGSSSVEAVRSQLHRDPCRPKSNSQPARHIELELPESVCEKRKGLRSERRSTSGQR